MRSPFVLHEFSQLIARDQAAWSFAARYAAKSPARDNTTFRCKETRICWQLRGIVICTSHDGTRSNTKLKLWQTESLAWSTKLKLLLMPSVNWLCQLTSCGAWCTVRDEPVLTWCRGNGRVGYPSGDYSAGQAQEVGRQTRCSNRYGIVAARTSHTVSGLRAMPEQRPYVPWLWGRDKTWTVRISSSVRKLSLRNFVVNLDNFLYLLWNQYGSNNDLTMS